MHHYATHHPDMGPVLVQRHGALGDVVVCEFLKLGPAQEEADRLNREAQAMQEVAIRKYRPDCEWMQPRRKARFFENEDIHG